MILVPRMNLAPFHPKKILGMDYFTYFYLTVCINNFGAKSSNKANFDILELLMKIF